MSTMKIAEELVALCRAGKNEEVIDKHFHPDIESVENMDMPGIGRVQKGVAAVKAKGAWWIENHEIHEAVVEGPYPNGDRFIVRFKYEVTPKQTGKRISMDETALYTVANGKIVKEEFFYPTGA
jgi:ketosteroid isomerase-like protein